MLLRRRMHQHPADQPGAESSGPSSKSDGAMEPTTFVDLTIGTRCAPQRIVAISGLMETYRIIPPGRAYRVEAVQPNGQKRLVRSWPTEEAAVSHLKALREATEPLGRSRLTTALSTVATWWTAPHTILNADRRPRHWRG